MVYSKLSNDIQLLRKFSELFNLLLFYWTYMLALEQHFTTHDVDGLYLNQKELKEYDDFMNHYVLLVDKTKGKDLHAYDMFFRKYKSLSPKVQENVKHIYIEFKTAYFRSKIHNIIDGKTFKLDHKNFNSYVNGLYQIEGEENIDDFLDSESKNS